MTEQGHHEDPEVADNQLAGYAAADSSATAGRSASDARSAAELTELGTREMSAGKGYIALAAVIFGITLSTLHQSGLGALYLMAKGKVHPLWYTPILPLLFLLSAIAAGFPMVVFETVLEFLPSTRCKSGINLVQDTVDSQA